MSSQAALDLIVNLKGDAESKVNTLSSALGGLAKIGGTALLGSAIAGVAGLGAALAGGIADAREANLIMAQTQAVIESTGGAAGLTAEQIADMAGSLSAAEGKSLFGDTDIQQGQNLLLTFTNIKEVMPEATQTMLDMATAMGTTADAGAIQLGKALNDPVAGISALSRVGVTFTEQQKEQIKAMVEAGNVAGAQKVILAELNKEFGGSAAAAAAADGGMTMFKDRMGELAESIGAQVLPMLNSLMAWLNSPEVQTAIATIATGLVGAFQGVITVVSTVISFLEPLTPVLVGIGAAILVGLIPMIAAWMAATYLQVAANIALAAATLAAYAPIIAIAAAVGVAVGLLYLAWQTNFGGIREITAGVWNWITGTAWPALQAVFAAIVTQVGVIKAAWDRDWGAMKTFLSTTWETIKTAVSTAIEAVKTTIATVVATIKAAWETAWTAIKTTASTLWDGIKTVVRTAIETVKTTLSTTVDTIKTNLSTAWDTIKTAASTTWDTIKTAITTAIDTTKTTVGTTIETLKGFFTAGWDTVKSTIQGVFTAIGGFISGPIETAKSIVSSAISAIVGFIQGAIDKVNALIGLINAIPGVPNMPSIPNAGGGASGFGAQSVGMRSMSTTNANVSIVINAGNRREAEIGVQSALRSAGLA